jgi:hypothetical protein
MSKKEEPYNPLDYKNLTSNVVREMMVRDAVEMPVKKFGGPGVYALFYNGPFPPYAPFRSPDWTEPIYVGKAVLPGSRKGGKRRKLDYPALHGRISEHAASIDAASNLDLADFRVRYLTVIPLWITMAERFLIEHYLPIWNVCIEGFGIHDPGKGRHAGEISWWDALHPGRTWAGNLRQTRATSDAIDRLTTFLKERD